MAAPNSARNEVSSNYLTIKDNVYCFESRNDTYMEKEGSKLRLSDDNHNYNKLISLNAGLMVSCHVCVSIQMRTVEMNTDFLN